MSVTPIACGNCGAQYRLPESFTAPQAKCKKCGGTIDVAAQRAGDAKPAAAKPAAKPAGRPKATASSRPARSAKSSAKPKTERPARGGSTRSRRGDGDNNGDGDGGSKRGRRPEREKKSSGNAALIGGVVGLLAIIAVVLVFVMQSDDTANKEDTANSGDNAAAAEATANKDEGAAPAEATGDGDAQPAEGAATKEADPEPKEDKPAEKPKKPAKKELTAETIYKPMEELQELAWPDYVAEEEQQEIKDALQDIRDGGLHATRAKTALAQKTPQCMFGVANALRELNYLDTDDQMFAYELNQLMKDMTLGLNAGFKVSEYGEDVSLKDADWNGKTVRVWQQVCQKYGTPEAFKEFLKEQKKKRK